MTWRGEERRKLPDAQRTIVLDAQEFDRVMGHLFEAVTELTQAVKELKDTQPVAVATGIASVASDREIAAKLMNNIADVAQERATKAAGRGVWWVVKSALGKWVLIGAVVLLVAKAAGVDAAAAAWRLLTGGKP